MTTSDVVLRRNYSAGATTDFCSTVTTCQRLPRDVIGGHKWLSANTRNIFWQQRPVVGALAPQCVELGNRARAIDSEDVLTYRRTNKQLNGLELRTHSWPVS